MSPLPVAFLRPDVPPHFPDPEQALDVPNGLLAAGGSLDPGWLLAAYARGIFPWYSEGEPLLWWSPDPRCVFRTDGVHMSRRLHRQLRHCDWRICADTDFHAIITACATSRQDNHGTWLTQDMIESYCALHELGHAHSVEVRDGKRLVGGIYGVATGRMFCGESMFSTASGGSKVALLALARVLAERGWPLLDAQVPNPHLFRLGARMMPRRDYLAALADLQANAPPPGSWHEDWPLTSARDLA